MRWVRGLPKQMNHRIISILIGFVIIAAVVGGVVYWEWPMVSLRPASGPPPADADPPRITWTPESVAEVIAPGDTKRASVNFTSSKNIRRASVVISPELTPFVRAEPAFLERLRKGENRLITVVISVS